MKQLHDTNPCPICGVMKQRYLFKIHESSITSCTECGLIFSTPPLLLRESNESSIHFDQVKPKNTLPGSGTENEASNKYVRILVELSDDVHNILLIAEPEHCFATIARVFGLNILRHMSIVEIEEGNDVPQKVDAVIVIYQLEKGNRIEKILNNIYTALKPDGVLFLVTLSLDSRSARFFGQSWVGWRAENRYFFDNTNIQALLWRFGFNNVWLKKDLRLYTLAHIHERASSFPQTWITRTIRALYKILPSNFHNLYYRLPSSGVIVTARKTERRETQMLSVVLPVYNEATTFPVLMEKLLDLKLTGLEKELIIIESNSKDNSRELVLNYRNHPGVKILLQEKARGKGNAVREGLSHARGDIILIQDADLEYDLNDYEALLEPVRGFIKPFVLGSRHGGKWKMRHFSDQEVISTYFNFGHIVFTKLINLLYGQKMKDPFTMFKVFRRDCLHNLKFECNRFDFDFELVIKLIRKGYIPLEIPVNYNSRSYREGKKVDMFRDPVTWIKALLKYRFVKITKD